MATGTVERVRPVLTWNDVTAGNLPDNWWRPPAAQQPLAPVEQSSVPSQAPGSFLRHSITSPTGGTPAGGGGQGLSAPQISREEAGTLLRHSITSPTGGTPAGLGGQGLSAPLISPAALRIDAPAAALPAEKKEAPQPKLLSLQEAHERHSAGVTELDPTQHAIFRGGADKVIQSSANDLKVKKGLVQPTHGPSLHADPEKLTRFGGAQQIQRLPPGLKIIQRGKDKQHFELVATQPMSPDAYQALLGKVEWK